MKSIDLRFCKYINSDSLLSIAHNCNPVCLEELLLDGCENVDDYGLYCLTEKFSQLARPLTSLERVRSLEEDDLMFSFIDEPEMPPDFKGGARGLKVLSLAECRNITDQGVSNLRKLTRLQDLNLLGCFAVTNEGIGNMLNRSRNLEKLNLSGTSVSRDGLLMIKDKCSRLRILLLNGCRQLHAEDKHIFQGTKIKVILHEDTFRFQIAPFPGSSLPQITNNILRTRGTLAVQRVTHFVQRKLERDNLEVEVRSIQILCKDKVLSPYRTLKEIQHSMWDSSMLTLHYCLHEEAKKLEEIHHSQDWVGELPYWVPDTERDTCMICNKPFSIFNRRHHCRNCGKLLCGDCSKGRILIPRFGYTKKKVRVCSVCHEVISNNRSNIL